MCIRDRSRSADIVNAGLTEMTGATAPRLQLELICARLLLPGASGESGYAARLDRLERRLEMTGTSTSPSPKASTTSARRSAPPSPRPPEAPAVPVGRPEPVTAPAKEAVAKPQRLPPVESPPVQTRRVAPMPGGIDTDAIRRSWPDVLTKIATISRVTWSFVSQNTRVLDYNGERLLLGLSTDGLLTALRGRNHAEVVRQALIEVIGVDTKVEGVLSTDSAPTDSAPTDSAPTDPAPDDSASADPAPGAAVATDAEPDDDWNVSAPSKKSASAPTPPAPNAPAIPAPTPTPDRPSTPRQRARAAVAQEASRRRTNSSSSVADDSVVSADDENIEEAGDMGQPVIERVLGGMVIGELDQ